MLIGADLKKEILEKMLRWIENIVKGQTQTDFIMYTHAYSRGNDLLKIFLSFKSNFPSNLQA